MTVRRDVPDRLARQPEDNARATRPNPAACGPLALGLAGFGEVRAAPVLGLPGLLTKLGLDADAVLREHDCDPAIFEDPDNIISFGSIGRLLAHIAENTNCGYPGLELCRHLGLDVSGVVGRTVRLAPDVRSGLRCLILNLHLHDRGAVPYLWSHGQCAMLGYTLFCPDAVATEHIYDGALSIACNMIRELAGPGWQPVEVRLFRDRPDDPEPFREQFRSPLRFGARQSAVVFPASDLDRPCVDADTPRYRQALADLEALHTARAWGFADKVGLVLLRLLATEAALDGIAPDRADIAALFAMHPRTLNRRLAAEGITFSVLLSEARYAVARELLRDTKLPVYDIAQALGYAGTGPFVAAFRRWSGTTAARWRASHARG